MVEGRGAYGLGGGEDGGEADGLLEEHVVAALHLLRGRKVAVGFGRDLPRVLPPSDVTRCDRV